MARSIFRVIVRLLAREAIEGLTRDDDKELPGTWWSCGTEAKVESETVEVITVGGGRIINGRRIGRTGFRGITDPLSVIGEDAEQVAFRE